MMRLAAWLMLTLIVIAAAMLAAAAVYAAELTPEEHAGCKAEGGCNVVSRAWLQAQLKAAFSAGYVEGKGAVKCAPPMT